MSIAKPINGVVIVSECADCHKAIVWSQLENHWIHQRTYYKQCSAKDAP